MQPLKAQVRNGHLVIDEPTELPEGQVLYLVPVDDELDDDEREELDAEIEEALADIEAGRTIPGDVVMAKLRGRA